MVFYNLILTFSHSIVKMKMACYICIASVKQVSDSSLKHMTLQNVVFRKFRDGKRVTEACLALG